MIWTWRHWIWWWRWMDGGGSYDFALKVAERRTDLKFDCNNMIGSFNHSIVSSWGRVGVQVRNVCWKRKSQNSRNLKHLLSGDFQNSWLYLPVSMTFSSLGPALCVQAVSARRSGTSSPSAQHHADLRVHQQSYDEGDVEGGHGWVHHEGWVGKAACGAFSAGWCRKKKMRIYFLVHYVYLNSFSYKLLCRFQRSHNPASSTHSIHVCIIYFYCGLDTYIHLLPENQ